MSIQLYFTAYADLLASEYFVQINALKKARNIKKTIIVLKLSFNTIR